MLEFLQSPTFRRILYGLLGVLLPVVNQKAGLNVPTEQVMGAIGAMVALIASSTRNQTHAREVDATMEIAIAKAAQGAPLPSPAP